MRQHGGKEHVLGESNEFSFAVVQLLSTSWQWGSWGEAWAGASALEVSTEHEIVGVDEPLEGHVLSEKETKDGSDIQATEQPDM